MKDPLVVATFALVVVTFLLVAATFFSLALLRRQAEAAGKQAAASVQQAKATLRTLDHLLKQGLPDWFITTGGTESAKRLALPFRNTGGGPAASVTVEVTPPLSDGLRLLPISGPAAQRSVAPGEAVEVIIETAALAVVPWEGDITLRCVGRNGRKVSHTQPGKIVKDQTVKVIKFYPQGAGRTEYPGDLACPGSRAVRT